MANELYYPAFGYSVFAALFASTHLSDTSGNRFLIFDREANDFISVPSSLRLEVDRCVQVGKSMKDVQA